MTREEMQKSLMMIAIKKINLQVELGSIDPDDGFKELVEYSKYLSDKSDLEIQNIFAINFY